MDVDPNALAELAIVEMNQHRCAYAEVNISPITSGMEISLLTKALQRESKNRMRCRLQIDSLSGGPDGGVLLQIVPVPLVDSMTE